MIFLPYLSGELQPINDGNARGVFFGMTLGTNREDVARAVFEGAVFALAHNLEFIHREGLTVSSLRAVGGPAKNNLWCQNASDAMNLSITTHDDVGAPYGDALLAGHGVGLISDLALTINNRLKTHASFAPNLEHHRMYSQRLEVYRRLYPALRAEFAAHAKSERGAP